MTKQAAINTPLATCCGRVTLNHLLSLRLTGGQEAAREVPCAASSRFSAVVIFIQQTARSARAKPLKKTTPYEVRKPNAS